jgi:hypothetical protein
LPNDPTPVGYLGYSPLGKVPELAKSRRISKKTGDLPVTINPSATSGEPVESLEAPSPKSSSPDLSKIIKHVSDKERPEVGHVGSPETVPVVTTTSLDKVTNPMNSSTSSCDTPLEPFLRYFITLIQKSTFCLDNRLEPTVGSEEGTRLLSQSEGVKLYLDSYSNWKSVYTVFVEEASNRCRICNSSKSAYVRAVACVRSHLDHRPFACSGIEGECRRCPDTDGYVHLILPAITDSESLDMRVFSPRSCSATISPLKL